MVEKAFCLNISVYLWCVFTWADKRITLNELEAHTEGSKIAILARFSMRV